MKIPKNISGDLEIEDYLYLWRDKAVELSMEYGIFIDTIIERENRKGRRQSSYSITKIVFKAMDHEFESLIDLKKALENKALL